MPRLAVIDDSWKVKDPNTESYFFLAQRLFSPDGLLREREAIPMLQHFDQPGVSGIVDNGAYEGEMLSIAQLRSLIAFSVRVSGSKPLPVFVAPDYPGQPFRVTAEAYHELRTQLDPKVKLMVVPHSRPGDLEGYCHACRGAAYSITDGDWIGISILATPLALSGQGIFGVDRASFAYGPEMQRCYVLNALPRAFWDNVEAQQIPLHLLGLGWDWWQLAENQFLDRFQSIDTHKPATYAKLGWHMVPWLVVDRRHKSPFMTTESNQRLLDANVATLQHLLGNR